MTGLLFVKALFPEAVRLEALRLLTYEKPISLEKYLFLIMRRRKIAYRSLLTAGVPLEKSRQPEQQIYQRLLMEVTIILASRQSHRAVAHIIP
jgi:hypothetical protein